MSRRSWHTAKASTYSHYTPRAPLSLSFLTQKSVPIAVARRVPPFHSLSSLSHSRPLPSTFRHRSPPPAPRPAAVARVPLATAAGAPPRPPSTARAWPCPACFAVPPHPPHAARACPRPARRKPRALGRAHPTPTVPRPEARLARLAAPCPSPVPLERAAAARPDALDPEIPRPQCRPRAESEHRSSTARLRRVHNMSEAIL